MAGLGARGRGRRQASSTASWRTDSCRARSPRARFRVGLFKFSLPILCANVLQSLNGSVNSVWVGRLLGEAALTATSNANTVMFLLIGAAFGVALAATILIGQYIGANNLRETKRVVGTSATFFAASSP